MMYTIELVVGDWSHDGHCQTDTVVISSNLSKKDIVKAYGLGVQISGVNLEKIASDYEDGYLTAKDAQKLIAIGLNPDDYHEDTVGYQIHKIDCFAAKDITAHCSCLSRHKECGWDDHRAYVGMNPEGFVQLYLDLVRLGNPTFKYKITIKDYSNRINVGGYGLFGG